MLMLSMISNGLGKRFFAFQDPMKWIMGLNHGKFDRHSLIISISDLKSGGMKVCIWLVQVVLR